jgi:DNA-binding transcriptional regulator GbsR (MarR family)
LAYFIDRKSLTCFPCQELLASLTGLSERRVRSALKKLEFMKLITRRKQRIGNRQASDLITLSKTLFQADESNIYRRTERPGNYKEQGTHSAQAEMPPKKNKSIRP